MINGYRRFEKIRLVIACAAFLCAVALLVCYAAVFTVSKYKTEIDGYTNFEISSFHAILLGNMTKEEIMETWTDTTKQLTLFGEEVSVANLSPGMESACIPFSLSNGTSVDDISGMDFEFTLRVRTTGNIPLTFRLLWKEITEIKNASGQVIDTVETEHTYVTNGEYYLEEGAKGDAPRYIYTFVEQRTDNGITYTDDNEHYFYMSGGTLSVESFELQMDWPLGVDAYGDDTNSSKYMKEVDVIDMLAIISSKNRSETYTGSSGTPTYYSDGYILVKRGTGNFGSETEGESFVLSFDFRAFEIQSSASEYTESDYSFVVGNGNDIYNGSAILNPTTSSYTNFKLEIAVPLTVDTQSKQDSVRSCAIYIQDVNDSNEDGDKTDYIEITSTSISYRLYDITDDTYESFESRAEALAYINDADYDYVKSNLRMYKIYTPSVNDNQAHYFSLSNLEADASIKYDSLKFKIRMTGSPITSVTALENIPRVVVTAYYENSERDNSSQGTTVDSGAIGSGAIDSGSVIG